MRKRKLVSRRGDVELLRGSHFTSFSSVCTLNRCSSERRSWMLFCGSEERVSYWQKTCDLYIFLSWANSEFAVPTTLGNFSLNLPSFTVEFSRNLSCNVSCTFGLRLSPWDLGSVPDVASTNKSALASSVRRTVLVVAQTEVQLSCAGSPRVHACSSG